jgi:outer membrane protein assembly factor BamD (BamD/ComL family)
MKRLIYPALLLVALTAPGCTGDKGKELFETAQFEEKQHNLPHAQQLYEEILAKYPQSAVANQAKERLDALKKGR